jgi:hypothetical protein
MDNSNRNYWVAGGIIVAVIILIFSFRGPDNNTPKAPSPTATSTNPTASTTPSGQTTTGSSTKTPTSGTTKPATGNLTFEGRLEASDDASKGNLKLVTSGNPLYLRSSRDYSSLYGKDVIVHASGTATGFRFESIEAK